MTVTVAWTFPRGSEICALPQQHGFETIKLRLQVGCAPELNVDLTPLALKLDTLLFDATPLFLKFRTAWDVASHLAFLASERQG